MRTELYKTCILTYPEMEILLNRLSCSGLYGMFKQDTETSREQIYRTIADLINRRVLIPQKDKFRIREDVRIILDCMTRAGSYLKISIQDGEQADCICYLTSDTVVTAEYSRIRKASVILSQMDYENFIDNCLTGFLPQAQMIWENAEEKDQTVLCEDQTEMKPGGGQMPQEEICMAYELYTDGLERKRGIYVTEYLLDYYILNVTETAAERYPYHYQTLQHDLTDMIMREKTQSGTQKEWSSL